MSDILEELDRWIEQWTGIGDNRHPRLPMLQRVRDEIVTLRRITRHGGALFTADYVAAARAEALEEAAQICLRLYEEYPQCGLAAAAIRALKDKA
jgi:hypothetical protein